MNYIYEKLREENKLFEIKDDVILSKILPKENALSPNFKNSQKSIKNYNSGGVSPFSLNVNGNTNLVFQVKNDKVTEDFLIAKNYIKVLKQSEFFLG